MEEKLKVVKDLPPGSDGSASEFQGTIKEEIITTYKQKNKKNFSTQSIRLVNI